MSEIPAKRVVITSFIVDIIDIITNIVVAIVTGSVVMSAETIQGFTDLFAVTLLLIGLKNANRGPDPRHPFGHGRDLYFWTLLSSILMLILTATITFSLGVIRFIHVEQVDNIFLAYGVLVLAILTNGYALSLDMRRLSHNLPKRKIFTHFFQSPYIETKATFVLDLIGVCTASLGLLSLTLLKLTGDLHFDGIGAMVMGATLGALSFVLISGAKELLIGKTASQEIHREIRAAVRVFDEVREVTSLKTTYIGNNKLLVLLDLHFKSEMTTHQIEHTITEIKKNIKLSVPEAEEVQIEIA